MKEHVVTKPLQRIVTATAPAPRLPSAGRVSFANGPSSAASGAGPTGNFEGRMNSRAHHLLGAPDPRVPTTGPDAVPAVPHVADPLASPSVS